MSFVTTRPEALTAAAGDLRRIGSAMSSGRRLEFGSGVGD